MFKIGDKVRVKSAELPTYWYASRIGEVFTLVEYDKSNDDWLVEEADAYLGVDDIELVSQFDLKKNPWFIRTGTKEKSEAAQKWLFGQGMDWMCNDSVVYARDNQVLSNVSRIGDVEPFFMWCIDGEPHKPAKEIILEFETTVKSVTYPSIEIEQCKKIKELKETIDKAQQQLEEMMGK